MFAVMKYTTTSSKVNKSSQPTKKQEAKAQAINKRLESGKTIMVTLRGKKNFIDFIGNYKFKTAFTKTPMGEIPMDDTKELFTIEAINDGSGNPLTK